MIIQIRGTSGSGKSTIIRNLLDLGAKTSFRVPGRRQPQGYLVAAREAAIGNFCVPGHYETACGGCDTLPGYDTTFSLVRQSLQYAPKVIFEGLLVSEEVRRTIELHEDLPGDLRVLFLNTPVEVCLESIRARRAARGDDRPLKEDNTRNRIPTIERACEKLREAGVEVYETVSRDEAAAMVKEWLRGR